MTIATLIDRLKDYPADQEVMLLDGFNGGGEPREINVGPYARVITKQNANNGADCEDKVGQTVVVMGFGCY